MRKIGWFAVILFIAALPAAHASDAPRRLAGFTLGGDIDDFRGKINSKTVIPVRYVESLKEVEATSVPGFKTGLVYYGTCAVPSRIVRLEFKYSDSSRKFYDELMSRFRQRHGEPDDWRGDPFHIVIGWKWSFTDAAGNDISLILKHNQRDEEKKEGNYVKMTMWNLMKEEIHCFETAHPETEASAAGGGQNEADWDLLVPR